MDSRIRLVLSDISFLDLIFYLFVIIWHKLKLDQVVSHVYLKIIIIRHLFNLYLIKQLFNIALMTRLSMILFLLKFLQLHNVETTLSSFSNDVHFYVFIFLVAKLLFVLSLLVVLSVLLT